LNETEGSTSSSVYCLVSEDSKETLQGFADSLYRLTPDIYLGKAMGSDGLVRVFIDFSKINDLGGRIQLNEDRIKLKLLALARRFKLVNPRVGVGKSFAFAYVSAKNNCISEKLGDLSVSALEDFADPMGEDLEYRIEARKIVSKLSQLGVLRIKQFIKLPRRSLSSRFGALGIFLYSWIAGVDRRTWDLFIPEEEIKEELDLRDLTSMSACSDLESILFSLKSCTDRMMMRLAGRGFRVLSFDIELEQESYLGANRFRKVEIRLPFPQASPQKLIQVLREVLNREIQKTPLETGVIRVMVLVLETAPRLSFQRNLLDQTEDFEESWNEFFNRISVKMGDQRVFFASLKDSYLPERAWGRAIEKKKDEEVVFDFAPRPSRIFNTPEVLHFSQSALYSRRMNRRWRVLFWQGPERIESNWWESKQGSPLARDYYRVTAESGEHLWVFRNGKQVFLHGIFD